MWEVPFYGILVPTLTILFSLLFSIKFEKYFLIPVILFFSLNILTIIIPFISNVGWVGLFGWAVFFGFVSLLISGIVWALRVAGINIKLL